jgi:hypothetical protein
MSVIAVGRGARHVGGRGGGSSERAVAGPRRSEGGCVMCLNSYDACTCSLAVSVYECTSELVVLVVGSDEL